MDLEFKRQNVRIEYESLDAGMAENEETVPPVVAARKVLEPEGKWDALRATWPRCTPSSTTAAETP